jgi:hypothetical protein
LVYDSKILPGELQNSWWKTLIHLILYPIWVSSRHLSIIQPGQNNIWTTRAILAKVDLAPGIFESLKIWRIWWSYSGETTLKSSALYHAVWQRCSPKKGQKYLFWLPKFLCPSSFYIFILFVWKSMLGCSAWQSLFFKFLGFNPRKGSEGQWLKKRCKNRCLVI